MVSSFRTIAHTEISIISPNYDAVYIPFASHFGSYPHFLAWLRSNLKAMMEAPGNVNPVSAGWDPPGSWSTAAPKLDGYGDGCKEKDGDISIYI